MHEQTQLSEMLENKELDSRVNAMNTTPDTRDIEEYGKFLLSRVLDLSN